MARFWTRTQLEAIGGPRGGLCTSCGWPFLMTTPASSSTPPDADPPGGSSPPQPIDGYFCPFCTPLPSPFSVATVVWDGDEGECMSCDQTFVREEVGG